MAKNTDTTQERWLPVVGWEDIYSVSDKGRIRTEKNGHIHKMTPDIHGYLKTTLSKRPRVICRSIHSLVAAAFIGPRPDGYQVNHKNGVKTDNRVENLEYCTLQENLIHADKVLDVKRLGERHGMATLTEQMVLSIRKNIHDLSQRELAEMYGVHCSLIYQIQNRIVWTHLP